MSKVTFKSLLLLFLPCYQKANLLHRHSPSPVLISQFSFYSLEAIVILNK
jgi:hypothetical protein